MRIRKDHELGIDEAKRRVEKIAGELNQQFGLASQWDGDDLRVTGSGVNGRIAVADKDVEVDVRLGFALMMLEGRIQSDIQAAMDEHLS